MATWSFRFPVGSFADAQFGISVVDELIAFAADDLQLFVGCFSRRRGQVAHLFSPDEQRKLRIVRSGQLGPLTLMGPCRP